MCSVHDDSWIRLHAKLPIAVLYIQAQRPLPAALLFLKGFVLIPKTALPGTELVP